MTGTRASARSTGQPGEHGRGQPSQPWTRSTLATWSAVAHGCHRTCVPAVPEGLLPVHGGGVVTVLVPPLVLGPVAEPPVQLDHDPISLVHAVPPSAPPVRIRERRLPDRLRQPVRPFHVAVVAVLQHRVVSASRGSDELMQVSAPAQLRPLAHRRAQPALVGQVPRERASHPPAHVIERRGSLRQVKHRLLHPGPRRIAVALHSLDRPAGPVQADAFGRLDPTLDRDGHVNHLGWLVSEPLQLGSCFVTEHRAWSGREDGRPELRAASRASGERRVDTGIELLPAAAADPELDHALGEAAPEGLRAGDDPALVPDEVAERERKLTLPCRTVSRHATDILLPSRNGGGSGFCGGSGQP